jgi:hypothetical protein
VPVRKNCPGRRHAGIIRLPVKATKNIAPAGAEACLNLKDVLEANEEYPPGPQDMPSLGLDPALGIYRFMVAR